MKTSNRYLDLGICCAILSVMNLATGKTLTPDILVASLAIVAFVRAA